jgi:copper chaperone
MVQENPGRICMMESTTLVAPDISCEQCQHAIEGAVGKLDGVSKVNVDIPTKTVHINYDPQKVTLTKIEEVLDDTGYTVAK